MNRIADKATIKNAAKAFNAGRELVISDQYYGPTKLVTSLSNTVKRSKTYRWADVMRNRSVWHNRYPDQTFYIVREAE